MKNRTLGFKAGENGVLSGKLNDVLFADYTYADACLKHPVWSGQPSR